MLRGVRISSFGVVCAQVALVLASTNAPVSAASRWSQTYGGSATYEGTLALRELPDGSVVVGGYTDSFGTQTADAWWIRIDPEGSVLGERVHGNALPGGAADIVIDPDGGLAVVGAHTLDIFSDRDAWIHHVDAGGTIDWEVGFDGGPGLHNFFAVAAAHGGGYLATGATAESPGPPIYALAARLDASGNVLWEAAYHGGVAEHANFVVPTADGGYAIAGWTTSSGAGSTDIWLLKINGAGAIEWQRTYGGFDQEEATGLIQTEDGGYALSAFTSTFPASGFGAMVLRLDADGDVLWHKVMGDEWADFRGITQTADGNLIATGRIAGPSSNDLWVVKFRGSDGAVLWQRAYEGTEGDWGSETLELADGDLLIAGIWAWGFAGEDIWLQRTDSEGRIAGCTLIRDTAVMTTSPLLTVQSAITVRSDPGIPAVTLDFVSGASSLTESEKCRATVGVEETSPPPSVSVTPNPVRSTASIAFVLEQEDRVRLEIHDSGGRLLDTLVEGTLPTGAYRFTWDARERELPAGVYYVVLDSGGENRVRRAIVLH